MTITAQCGAGAPPGRSELEQRIQYAQNVIQHWGMDPHRENVAVSGSTARGWFDASSDIDVVIVSDVYERQRLETSGKVLGLSITHLNGQYVQHLFNAKYLDLAGLRVLSNLASAISIFGDAKIFELASDANKRACLSPDVSAFYLATAENSASCLLDQKGCQITILNCALQAVLLLVCANSKHRVTKLKWTMKTVSETSESIANACEDIFDLLQSSATYARLSNNFFPENSDNRQLLELVREIEGIISDSRLSHCVPTSTEPFLRLCLSSAKLRLGCVPEPDHIRAEADWVRISELLRGIIKTAKESSQFA